MNPFLTSRTLAWILLVVGWIMMALSLPEAAFPLFLIATFIFARLTYLAGKELWRKYNG